MTRHMCFVAGCANKAGSSCLRPFCPGTQLRESTVADIPDAELLRRAVTNAHGESYRWQAVMQVFGLSST